MKRFIVVMSITLVCALGLFLVQNNLFAKPHTYKGEVYPEGRFPQEIKDGKYPRTYFPNTEILGKDEMRITALGTGMPTQTPSNKSACFLVELGNGDKFLFDLGVGATDMLSGLQSDYARLDKIFVSHLHTDHIGDLASLWVAGWIGGRYTPLHVYGPSSSSPELGTKVHVDHVRDAWAWDVTSRAGTLPNAGGEIVAHEFDFSKTAVIYDENGVKIYAFPVAHILIGAVGYRLEWNGLSWSFHGDGEPNTFEAELSKGVDVFMHEAFLDGETFSKKMNMPLREGLQEAWAT